MLLYNAVRERFSELENGPAMDPIFPFIKQEPHKKEKLETKRFRIISGVGATDQLVAELLFRPILDDSQYSCLLNGIAIGWSPNLPGGIRSFNLVTEKKTVAADKSSWDWTVNAWQSLFAQLFLVASVKVLPDIVRNHVAALLGPKTFLFRGRKFQTTNPGVMPSGWKLTIFMNSILQHACHLMAGGVGELLAMGDDTIQEEEDSAYWEKLQSIGPIMKETHR